MSRVDTSRYHNEFEARIRELLDWEARVDTMAASASNRDWMRNRQREAILLFAFSHWERLCERLFCANLASDLAQFGREVAVPLSGSVPLPIAQALVAGERYFSVGTYSDLLGRAGKLLASHPFAKVPAPDREMLDKAHALRNHVAHGSRTSLMRLRKKSVTRWREVGVHLRAVDKAKGCARLKCYLEAFIRASRALR